MDCYQCSGVHRCVLASMRRMRLHTIHMVPCTYVQLAVPAVPCYVQRFKQQVYTGYFMLYHYCCTCSIR